MTPIAVKGGRGIAQTQAAPAPGPARLTAWAAHRTRNRACGSIMNFF